LAGVVARMIDASSSRSRGPSADFQHTSITGHRRKVGRLRAVLRAFSGRWKTKSVSAMRIRSAQIGALTAFIDLHLDGQIRG
jgi:hypothetical protein